MRGGRDAAALTPTRTGGRSHESWWSYELCHGEHVRQMHLVPITSNVHGNRRVEVSHVLGRHVAAATRSGAVFDVTKWAHSSSVAAQEKAGRGADGGAADGDDVRPLAPPFVGVDEAGTPFLSVQWGHGSPCDLTGKPRRVTIRYACGAWVERGADVSFTPAVSIGDVYDRTQTAAHSPVGGGVWGGVASPWQDSAVSLLPRTAGRKQGLTGSTARIVSVREEGTCAYRVRVETSLLCPLRAFWPLESETRRLRCERVEEAAGEDGGSGGDGGGEGEAGAQEVVVDAEGGVDGGAGAVADGASVDEEAV